MKIFYMGDKKNNARGCDMTIRLPRYLIECSDVKYIYILYHLRTLAFCGSFESSMRALAGFQCSIARCFMSNILKILCEKP